MVSGAGCDVLLHAFVQDVSVHNGRVVDLLVATKAGLTRVRTRVVVDASGDADVCYHAGFGYELTGSTDPAQTLTTTFRMVKVDDARRSRISKDDLHAMTADAAQSGDFDLPRREGSDHPTPIPSVTATVMTRIDHVEHRNGTLVNATDPAVLSRAEMEGRRQALEFARFLIDRVPGCEHASLVALSSQVGVRETRRVFGDYRLTRDDVLSAQQFDDQIGLCGAPIEDHHGGSGTGTTWEYLPEGTAVGIPLRSLIVRDSVNAFVAGRCFSASHDAQASIRSMAQCMAMGQAAGTAAAMAAERSGESRSVDLERLCDRLRSAGVILSMEASSST